MKYVFFSSLCDLKDIWRKIIHYNHTTNLLQTFIETEFEAKDKHKIFSSQEQWIDTFGLFVSTSDEYTEPRKSKWTPLKNIRLHYAKMQGNQSPTNGQATSASNRNIKTIVCFDVFFVLFAWTFKVGLEKESELWDDVVRLDGFVLLLQVQDVSATKYHLLFHITVSQ